MEKIKKFIDNYYSKIVVVPTTIICILAFLLCYISSIAVTSDLTITSDIAPYQFKDYPILHILLLPLILIFITKLYDKKISEKRIKYLMIDVCLLVSLIMMIFGGFLFADPSYSIYAARAIAGNHKYDSFLMLYPARYPYQSTYIWFLTLFTKPFGYFDFYVLKIAEAVMYFFSLTYIKKIFKNFLEQEYSWLIDVSLILFIPLWLTSEFTYDDIPGLLFVVLGIYIYQNKNSKLSFAVSAILTGLGTAIRNNYLILLIAFCIVMFADKKKLRTILFFALTILTYKGISYISYAGLKILCPEIVNWEQNYPITRWLYIGLSESETGAGYWDIKTALGEESRTLLTERLQYFMKEIPQTLRFFAIKLANAYTSPDYDALDGFRHKDTVFFNISLFKGFLYERDIGYQIVLWVFNLFQSLIYAGNALFLLLDRNRNIKKYFGLIYFTGIFLFYIPWEIKARYVIVAVLFVIPTAVLGFYYLSKIKFTKKQLILIGIVAIIAIAAAYALRQFLIMDQLNQVKLNDLQNAMDTEFIKVINSTKE